MQKISENNQEKNPMNPENSLENPDSLEVPREELKEEAGEKPREEPKDDPRDNLEKPCRIFWRIIRKRNRRIRRIARKIRITQKIW